MNPKLSAPPINLWYSWFVCHQDHSEMLFRSALNSRIRPGWRRYDRDDRL